jgi:hypothetical protein
MSTTLKIAEVITEVHAQISELTGLAADLRAAATLSKRPVDGPCDETCGCTTDTAPSAIRTGVPLIAMTDAARRPRGAR